MKDFDIFSYTFVGLSGVWYTTSNERQAFMSGLQEGNLTMSDETKDIFSRLYLQLQKDDIELYKDITSSCSIAKPAFRKSVGHSRVELRWIHIAQRFVLFDRLVWAWMCRESGQLYLPQQTPHMEWTQMASAYAKKYQSHSINWRNTISEFKVLCADPSDRIREVYDSAMVENSPSA